MRKIMQLLCVSTLIFTLSACTPTDSEKVSPTDMPTPIPTEAVVDKNVKIKPYDDIRYLTGTNESAIFEEAEYYADDIPTYTFNEGTVLKGNEELQRQVLENGKNPGLGVRTLHDAGITGKGVNVAIIDQNLLLDHPEFAGKISAYYDTGCDVDPARGSMHAPAVTSLLVGNSIGVAPDAKVYFAAAPTWLGDTKYEADALYWIIEQNKSLPESEKIRVVSVSAAPSGPGTPRTQNQQMWDEAVLAAQNEGMLVLDCRDDSKTGIIGAAFYDPTNPDDVSLCVAGYPSSPERSPSERIGVPNSYRTVAEEYTERTPSYQYCGQGGQSWAIPYAAGVLALGWQVNPNLDNDQIINILFETCFINKDGCKIINPPAFIEAVKKAN